MSENSYVTRAELKEELERFECRLDAKFATKEDLADVKVELVGMISGVDTKVGVLDTKVGDLDAKVARLDSKFDGLATKVAGLDAKFDGLAGKVSNLDAKVDNFEVKLEAQTEIILHQMQILLEQERSEIIRVTREENAVTNSRIDSLVRENNLIERRRVVHGS